MFRTVDFSPIKWMREFGQKCSTYLDISWSGLTQSPSSSCFGSTLHDGGMDVICATVHPALNSLDSHYHIRLHDAWKEKISLTFEMPLGKASRCGGILDPSRWLHFTDAIVAKDRLFFFPDQEAEIRVWDLKPPALIAPRGRHEH